MCVPFTGSEAWTRSLGYKIVDEWRAWISNDQVAGYSRQMKPSSFTIFVHSSLFLVELLFLG